MPTQPTEQQALDLRLQEARGRPAAFAEQNRAREQAASGLGVGALDRSLAALKMTPEGAASLIQKRVRDRLIERDPEIQQFQTALQSASLNQEARDRAASALRSKMIAVNDRVASSIGINPETGSVGIRTSAGVLDLDEPVLSGSDIAESAKEAVKGLISGVASIAGGIPGGVASDAALGVAEQAIGAALPGTEDVSATQRAARLGVEVGTGLASELGGAALGKVGDIVRGSEASIARTAGREIARQAGFSKPSRVARQAADELEKRAGSFERLGLEAPDVATLSGSRSLRGLVRQVGDTGVAEKRQRALEGMAALLDSEIEAFRRSGTGALDAPAKTKSLASASRRVFKELREDRARKAAPGYARAEEAGISIPQSNTIRAAQEELDRLLRIPEPQRIGDVKKQIELLESAVGGGAVLSPLAHDAKLQVFGNYARGKGIPDFDDRSSLSRIGAILKNAAERDLDEAIEAGGEGALDLATARAAYRAGSQKIERAKNTILADALKLDKKGQSQRVVDKFFTPGFTREQTIDFVDVATESGAVKELNDFRSAVWEKILEGSKGASGEINGSALSNLIKKNKGKLEALSGPGSLQRISDIQFVAQTMAPSKAAKKGFAPLIKQVGDALDKPLNVNLPINDIIDSYIEGIITRPDAAKRAARILRGLPRSKATAVGKIIVSAGGRAVARGDLQRFGDLIDHINEVVVKNNEGANE